MTQQRRIFSIDALLAGVKEAKREERKIVLEKLRGHKDYKIMVRIVRGGYRNMSCDSDWELLLKELNDMEVEG